MPLHAVREAVLVTSDGASRTAQEGDVLPNGATVRTGATGAARLDTVGRSVYLGALSTFTVTDGLRATLDKGQLMVDVRRGARLALTTPAGTVSAPAGLLAQSNFGPLLRLGVFDGIAAVTAVGRRATAAVPRYYQLQMSYDGIAGRTTALALTDDAWESRLASDLVSADLDLGRLAGSLDGAVGATVLAAFHSSAAAGPVRSEQALSATLARVARRGGSAAQRLEGVRGARASGGSWGVVAAIFDARVTAASGLLDALLAPAAAVVEAGGPFGTGGRPTLPSALTSSGALRRWQRLPLVSGPARPRTPVRPSHPTVPSTPTAPAAQPPPSPPTPVDRVLATVLHLVSPRPSPHLPLAH